MNLMIASDIHGSEIYCRKLMEAFDRENPLKLLLLGDLLYHGPRNQLPAGYNPQETAALLNQKKEAILCVRGNCEAEVDQLLLEFPVLAESCLLFWQGKTILAAHGHHREDAPPPLQKGDILLCGHTHIPACQTQENGVIYLNPGSVSIPKENSAHGYLLLTQKEAQWKDLDGNLLRREPLFV